MMRVTFVAVWIQVFVGVGAQPLAVTTFAGSGNSMTADGVGTAASFARPKGILAHPNGIHLFVTDILGDSIRRIDIATASTITFAGGQHGHADGTGTSAAFWNPQGIDANLNGTTLYVADSCRIRKVDVATQAVTTLAGNCNNPTNTFANGVGTLAKFFNVMDVAVSRDGHTLFSTDYGSYTGSRVRMTDVATRQVTTLAGNRYADNDGVGTSASFYFLDGVVVSPVDTNKIFVIELYSGKLKQIMLDTKRVTTIAHVPQMGYMHGLEIDAAGARLFMGTTSGYWWEFDISSQTVTLLAGQTNHEASARGVTTGADGIGTSAVFGDARGYAAISTDETTLYVTDPRFFNVRRIALVSSPAPPPSPPSTFFLVEPEGPSDPGRTSDQANGICLHFGGLLAKIGYDAQQSGALASLQAAGATMAWLGGRSDPAIGAADWRWAADGPRGFPPSGSAAASSTYSNWAADEPASRTALLAEIDAKLCVAMNVSDGRWHAITCDASLRHAVCQTVSAALPPSPPSACAPGTSSSSPVTFGPGTSFNADTNQCEISCDTSGRRLGNDNVLSEDDKEAGTNILREAADMVSTFLTEHSPATDAETFFETMKKGAARPIDDGNEATDQAPAVMEERIARLMKLNEALLNDKAKMLKDMETLRDQLFGPPAFA